MEKSSNKVFSFLPNEQTYRAVTARRIQLQDYINILFVESISREYHGITSQSARAHNCKAVVND